MTVRDGDGDDHDDVDRTGALAWFVEPQYDGTASYLVALKYYCTMTKQSFGTCLKNLGDASNRMHKIESFLLKGDGLMDPDYSIWYDDVICRHHTSGRSHPTAGQVTPFRRLT